MHKEVKIGFFGDKVQDAGGLMREWLFLLFKELTHPHLGIIISILDEIRNLLNCRNE